MVRPLQLVEFHVETLTQSPYFIASALDGRPTLIALDHLADFRRWAALNPEMTLSEYAHATVSVDHFFAVASTLCPEFVRHGEGLFLADGFSPESFERWMASCQADLTRVERVMNHRHVSDLLAAFACDNEVRSLESAADLLQRCWTAQIRSAFPSISAKVVIYKPIATSS